MNRSSLPLQLCPALQEFVLSEVHLVQIKLQRKSCQMLSVSIAIHIPRWEKPTSPPDNRVMVKMTEIMVTMTIHTRCWWWWRWHKHQQPQEQAVHTKQMSLWNGCGWRAAPAPAPGHPGFVTFFARHPPRLTHHRFVRFLAASDEIPIVLNWNSSWWWLLLIFSSMRQNYLYFHNLSWQQEELQIENLSKARKSRLLKHLKKCGFGDLIITLWLNWLKVVVGPLLMICGLFCDMANCGKKLGEIRNYVLFTNIALLEYHQLAITC